MYFNDNSIFWLTSQDFQILSVSFFLNGSYMHKNTNVFSEIKDIFIIKSSKFIICVCDFISEFQTGAVLDKQIFQFVYALLDKIVCVFG